MPIDVLICDASSSSPETLQNCQSSALQEPMPLPIPNAGNKEPQQQLNVEISLSYYTAEVIDPTQMETQPLYWESFQAEPAEPKNRNNRQADKASSRHLEVLARKLYCSCAGIVQAMRPPIEAVQPELPSDLLPGLASQIQQNLSAQGPDDDLVQAQRQVPHAFNPKTLNPKPYKP